jgi:transposase
LENSISGCIDSNQRHKLIKYLVEKENIVVTNDMVSMSIIRLRPDLNTIDYLLSKCKATDAVKYAIACNNFTIMDKIIKRGIPILISDIEYAKTYKNREKMVEFLSSKCD